MAPAFVQGYNGGGNVLSSSGAPSTATIQYQTQNTGAGNLLIIAFRTNLAGGALTGLTDSQNNKWNFLTFSDAGVFPFYFGWALNTAGGSKAIITMTFASAQSGITPVLGEYSGVNTLRGSDAGNAGSSGNPTSAAVVAVAGDLLIGYFGSTALQGVSQGAGYTLREAFVFAGTTDEAGFEDNTNAAGGSTTASFGQTSSGAWAAGISAFYFRSSGGSFTQGYRTFVNKRGATAHRRPQ